MVCFPSGVASRLLRLCYSSAMADLFSVTAPLVIRFPNDEKIIMVERIAYDDGLLFLPTFWIETGIENALRFVGGPIKGDGPWKVGDAVVAVLACHGTDATVANDFSCWQSYLAQVSEQYPSSDEIKEQMKLRAATIADVSHCHPKFSTNSVKESPSR